MGILDVDFGCQNGDEALGLEIQGVQSSTIDITLTLPVELNDEVNISLFLLNTFTFAGEASPSGSRSHAYSWTIPQ